MIVTTASRTIDRAIENIERLALDAIAALRLENAHLAGKVTERELAVGIAQAGAELAYAALSAAKSPVRPDGVELTFDKIGWNDDRERKALAATKSFARRIKDAQ